jgi:type VI secretion system protein ImpA
MTPANPSDFAAPFSVDLEALLAPIPTGNGVGASLRSESLYRQIGDARRQDDATLPMGEWERPLIKADWKTVASLGGEALRTHTKDFQLAAWLCEAWTHLHGIDGFVAGTQLLTGLVERYWDFAYPQIEDGDTDARAAPFVWINHTLALVLSLNVPVMVIEAREPSAVSLDEFQRTIGAPGAQDGNELTRELIDKHVAKDGNLVALAVLQQRLAVARDAWDKFARLVDLRLDADAPSFAPVADVLARLSRAATGLIGEHTVQLPSRGNAAGETSGDPLHAGGPARAMTADGSWQPQPRHDAHGYSSSIGESSPPTPHTTAATLPMTQIIAAGAATRPADTIADRSHAYRLLDDIADYLARHEPHSPTPYLLKRAVSWGQLPLAELMREIVRQEGDLTRYLSLLGLE